MIHLFSSVFLYFRLLIVIHLLGYAFFVLNKNVEPFLCYATSVKHHRVDALQILYGKSSEPLATFDKKATNGYFFSQQKRRPGMPFTRPTVLKILNNNKAHPEILLSPDARFDELLKPFVYQLD